MEDKSELVEVVDVEQSLVKQLKECKELIEIQKQQISTLSQRLSESLLENQSVYNDWSNYRKENDKLKKDIKEYERLMDSGDGHYQNLLNKFEDYKKNNNQCNDIDSLKKELQLHEVLIDTYKKELEHHKKVIAELSILYRSQKKISGLRKVHDAHLENLQKLLA